MIVRYFAYLRDYAGCKEETIYGPETALALLRVLGEKHGPKLSAHLIAPGGEALHQDLIFLIDGRNVDFLSQEDSPLPADCVVSLFPRIAGG